LVFGSSPIGSSDSHNGLSFIICLFSSYSIRLLLDKNFDSSISLINGMSSWVDSSFSLCHVPSLIAVKNVSMANLIVLIIVLWLF
jgi:hypothetical protein